MGDLVESRFEISVILLHTVSHTKLLCKLQAYGFDGVLLAFIHDFISGRSQKVVLPNGHSLFMPVISGVPKGSVMGPLLFLFTRDRIYAIARICYRPSVCLSVCPSDGWIIQKRLRLGL